MRNASNRYFQNKAPNDLLWQIHQELISTRGQIAEIFHPLSIASLPMQLRAMNPQLLMMPFITVSPLFE